MARLSQTQRSEAIGMLRAGSTQIAVAQHFKCSRITIRKLTQRYQTTGMVNAPKWQTKSTDAASRTLYQDYSS